MNDDPKRPNDSTDPASGLTHLAETGRVHMVDVGDKPVSMRSATASGVLRTLPETLRHIQESTTPKGDPLAVGEIAGIMGAKRTSDLIPLCHPLPINAVGVTLETDEAIPGVRARATVRTDGRTGVEMEALTAVSCALLAVYDMCKAVDREMTIENIQLEEKLGGRRGAWKRR